MKSMSNILLAARCSAQDLVHDRKAIAATEFAVIVPLMLVMFFGTVEVSSGIAVDRKVTMVARTLSDLTSQAAPSVSVNDTYLQNVFTASIAIMTPYSSTPTKAQISEIYVDSNKVARIQWSKAATIASGATQATLTTSASPLPARSAGDIVSIPQDLLVPQTYLIFSEVNYLYVPAVGYVMAKSGVTLSEVSYTRPRQSACVIYNNLPAATSCPTP
jgi:Flp pilus assembly protein TadG